MARSIRDPPVMTEPYEDWKNEVLAWSCFVEDKTPADKQGIALFLSLEGDARKAASKVALTDMKKDNGLKLVLDELDKFYEKDKDRIGFLAYDKFNAFKRPDGMTVKDFMIKFDIMLNSCTANGCVIDDKIISHQMINALNVVASKKELIRTTLTKYTYKDTRDHILRLFCEDEAPAVVLADELSKLNVKTEKENTQENSYVMAGSSYDYNSKRRNNWQNNRRGRGSFRFHHEDECPIKRQRSNQADYQL